MNLSKKKEQELIEWGVRFFEMGYSAAFDAIEKTRDISRDLKIKAMRKYIKEISVETDAYPGHTEDCSARKGAPVCNCGAGIRKG